MIPPPLPPCVVDMRLTAAREHSMTASTLMSNTRFSVSASTASRREDGPVRPALFTSAVTVPMGRCGEPEEIAEPILWLLSEAASYTTGAILRVGGGR